jgi:uncharacterized lipoprotein YajG
MKIKLILTLLGVLILASCGSTSNTTTNVETTTETTTDTSTTTKEEITLAYRE